MIQGDSASVIRYEGSDQVLVTGMVEDTSERLVELNVPLKLFTKDGLTFQLVRGNEVAEIKHLSGKRACIFGTIEQSAISPTITVLGYRILPEPNGDGFDTFRLKKRAA